MGEDNVNGLILDLRENRGGLLNEAVEVAGHFLRKDQTVVSHRGRSEPEQVFRAKTGNHGRQYPVVVLVNRNTASASEIVAGALQDHDRAWVMGENTFGKGLVQAQFPLSEDAALLLTIARYYTPSGRLIQRDYAHRSFFDYYYHNRQEDAQNSNDVKMTDSGRTVYGGGGITPDEKFPPQMLNAFQRRVRFPQPGEFFHFGSVYFGAETPHLPQGWSPDDAVVERFRDYLRQQGMTFTDEEFAQNRAWVEEQAEVRVVCARVRQALGRPPGLDQRSGSAAGGGEPSARARFTRAGEARHDAAHGRLSIAATVGSRNLLPPAWPLPRPARSIKSARRSTASPLPSRGPPAGDGRWRDVSFCTVPSFPITTFRRTTPEMRACKASGDKPAPDAVAVWPSARRYHPNTLRNRARLWCELREGWR